MKKPLTTIYILAFLWSLASSLPIYIQSSFLEEIYSINVVGIIFIISTALAMLAMLSMPGVIRCYGLTKVALAILVAEVFSLIFLVHAIEPWVMTIFFIAQFITMNILGLNLDILLENQTVNEKTGRIRTMLLTITSLAMLISPFISGNIAERYSYEAIYFTSAMILLPTIFILIFSKQLLQIKSPFRKQRLILWLSNMRSQQPDLTSIFWLNLTLHIFFSILVLYLPIHLHKNIGFSWHEIGLLLTIMLIPYTLFQMPAGTMADKFFGEKEFTIAGLLLMAVSTMVIAILNTADFLTWGVVLFANRTGVTLLISMLETYFFKKVDVVDLDVMSAFRAISPLGYLIGASIGTVVLSVTSISTLFLILSIILLLALKPALSFHDTK